MPDPIILGSSCFQPRDYKPSDGPSFQALVVTCEGGASGGGGWRGRVDTGGAPDAGTDCLLQRKFGRCSTSLNCSRREE